MGFEQGRLFKGPNAPDAPQQGDLWIAQPTNDLWLHNGRRFFRPGVDVFNVLAFGAVGDGITDDTAAIQAAIAAARAYGRANSRPPGRVWLPPAGAQGQGYYAVSSIDATKLDSLEIVGPGAVLYGYKQTGTAKPIIDLTGSSGVRLRGFSVRGQDLSGNAPSVVPNCGILLAASSALGDSTNVDVAKCSVIGHFSAAPVYIYGGTDHRFEMAQFQQYTDGACAVIIDNSNTAALTSPYQTIAAGAQPTGEHSFYHCEFHDLAAGSGATTVQTIRLKNAYSVRFRDGNCSCSGARFVDLIGTNRNILFSGVQFYSDNGTMATNFVYNAGTVDGLTLDTCDYQAGPTNLLAGGNGAVYKGVEVNGDPAANSYSGKLVGITTSGTLTDSRISCGGLAVDVGTGTIGNTLLTNPGTITAGTDTSRKVKDAMDPWMGFCGAPDTTLGAGVTIYLGNGQFNATENNVAAPLAQAMTLRNLRVFTGASPGGSETYTFTVRKNGSDTTLTCTVSAAAQTASDTTHSVAFAAGDRLTVKVVGSGSAASCGGVNASVTGYP